VSLLIEATIAAVRI